MKKVTIAYRGVPSLIGKLYQLEMLLLGDFEFILNNSYLELNFERVMTVMAIPYIPFNWFILTPAIVIWACVSAGYLLYQVAYL